MQLRCIAIDDEPLALELIKNYAARIPSMVLVEVFEDALTAVEFLKTAQIDLAFVDIQMPDISGLDLIRTIQPGPMFIVTTAYKQFAWEGFELDVLDYLLKPFSFDRFSKSVGKAKTHLEISVQPPAGTKEEAFILVYVEYKRVMVPVSKIIYIEGLADYIRIHLHEEAPLMTLMSLKKILEKLPAAQFQRIHRSYIVNGRYIRSFTQKKLLLHDGSGIPVGEAYVENLEQWFR